MNTNQSFSFFFVAAKTAIPAPAAAIAPAITALDAPVAGDFEEKIFLKSVAFVVSYSVASVVSSANSTTAFTTTEPLFQEVIAF